MPRAIWKGTVIAGSDQTKVVEGDQYFTRDSVNEKYLRKSTTTTICRWRGKANYYDIVVNGEVNKDAAWYYPAPKPAARQIQDYIAFWRGVTIED